MTFAVFLGAMGLAGWRSIRGFEVEADLAQVKAENRLNESALEELEYQITVLESLDSILPRARALGLRFVSPAEVEEVLGR